MTKLTLDHRNRAQLAEALTSDSWIIACLCAAWCDVCNKYRANFERWADMHPDKTFVWIDIEDQADIVGDLDVTDFPTLLVQRGDIVVFFGPIESERQHAERILLALVSKTETELRAEASVGELHQTWQRDCNLRRRLVEATGA